MFTLRNATPDSEGFVDFETRGIGMRFAEHNANELIVTRIADGELSWRLRRLPLPADDAAGTHEYELRFDHRDDEADNTEITIRRDGAFLTLAEDPHFPDVVERVAVRSRGGIASDELRCEPIAP
jgi:hypothetical protein